MFQGLIAGLIVLAKRLAKFTIDILIIVGILLAIALSVVPAEGFIPFMAADGGLIFWTVVITYVALVAFGYLLVTIAGMLGEHPAAKCSRYLIVTIIVILGFPFIVSKIFFLMGVEFQTEIENILIISSIIRFFVKWWLGRRWGV